ncbi:MAG: isoprenylcysteine carboxylmethyltransferase family protein [Methanomicrobia archaeon]|nr:isoprenylcysteine carboxylmethyltransferase family protein [Methanomicrobia archaeon]
MALELYRYLLVIGLCTIIWFVNGRWLLHAARERIVSEIYMHTGLGLFFTLLTLELALGLAGAWPQYGLWWLEVIGLLLYIPAGVLVFSSMLELQRKGRPDAETGDFTATTALIDTGLYGIIREPMTLGMAIWSVALILVFQSLIAVLLGALAFCCFGMAARTEDEYNIRKFGDAYREYSRRVPLWNLFKGLRNV